MIGLDRIQGDAVHSGDVLCYLASAADMEIKQESLMGDMDQSPAASKPGPAIPPGMRLTQPARDFLLSHPIDISRLSQKTLITEAMLRELFTQSELLVTSGEPEAESARLTDKLYGPTDLIVYGGGGHGKSVIELVRMLKRYELVGVIDDGIPAGTDILGVPALGGKQILPGLFRQGVLLAVNAVGGIGNLLSRLNVFDSLRQAGFTCPVIVHPTAFIEASASLAEGIQVFPHAYLGSSTRVGFGSIINTGAIVSHDCILGKTVNLSPGAILAGGVQVGDQTLIGMGVTVNLEVKIGSRARIGNGATVKADVPDGTIVKAGSIWP